MSLNKVAQVRGSVELRERRPIAQNAYDVRGYTTVKVGNRTGDVEIFIDLAKLGPLVRKALNSKGGKAVEASGGLICKVKPGSVNDVKDGAA